MKKIQCRALALALTFLFGACAAFVSPFDAQAAEPLPLTVEISREKATHATGPFEIRIQFSRRVYGFGQGRINVVNGSVRSFEKASEGGDLYTAVVVPKLLGDVSIQIDAGACRDIRNIPNEASNVLTVVYDSSRLLLWFDFEDGTVFPEPDPKGLQFRFSGDAYDADNKFISEGTDLIKAGFIEITRNGEAFTDFRVLYNPHEHSARITHRIRRLPEGDYELRLLGDTIKTLRNRFLPAHEITFGIHFPRVQRLQINQSGFPRSGGELSIEILGENLQYADSILVYDGTDFYDAVPALDGKTASFQKTIPANETGRDRVMRLNVYIDGKDTGRGLPVKQSSS